MPRVHEVFRPTGPAPSTPAEVAYDRHTVIAAKEWKAGKLEHHSWRTWSGAEKLGCEQ